VGRVVLGKCCIRLVPLCLRHQTKDGLFCVSGGLSTAVGYELVPRPTKQGPSVPHWRYDICVVRCLVGNIAAYYKVAGGRYGLVALRLKQR